MLARASSVESCSCIVEQTYPRLAARAAGHASSGKPAKRTALDHGAFVEVAYKRGNETVTAVLKDHQIPMRVARSCSAFPFFLLFYTFPSDAMLPQIATLSSQGPGTREGDRWWSRPCASSRENTPQPCSLCPIQMLEENLIAAQLVVVSLSSAVAWSI